MVTNMNQFLQQEIDRLSDENAQMDEQLAAVGASPVGDYMANAGVAAEDAAQNVVAAGVQELMAEEELPEIAMPEGLDDIDNQWRMRTSRSWMQKFHRRMPHPLQNTQQSRPNRKR